VKTVSCSQGLFLAAAKFDFFKIAEIFYHHLTRCQETETLLTLFCLQVAVPDVVEAAKDADILIFVIPHQFIKGLGAQMVGKIKPTAIGLSLIKGFDVAEGGGIELISHIITKHLKIPCAVLMGANLANEVAEEKFCETTIGVKDSKMAPILRDLFQTPNFRVVVSDDVDAVEICGALKNIVACGAGFVDGLGLGDNTKAAVIRLGLMEMIKFVDVFYPGSKLATFFESCGVADLITTCYGELGEGGGR
jgi:glycerol-3-phosphate dehydrogenase (NAD+)